MNTDTAPDRLKMLEDIEKKITSALQNAALALQELGKERPVDKNLEKYASSYMQMLEDVETEMSLQINYLTQVATSQQHEGSCYAAQKQVQLLKGTIAEISRKVESMAISCDAESSRNSQLQRPGGT